MDDKNAIELGSAPSLPIEIIWADFGPRKLNGIYCTVLKIRVNPKKNAPEVSKAPKFAFGNFILILKIFLKLDDVQLRKLSICKNLLNNESDF